MYKQYDILNRYGRALEEETEAETDEVAYDETEPKKPSSQAEGYEQVFDLKVDLRPAELTPKKQ